VVSNATAGHSLFFDNLDMGYNFLMLGFMSVVLWPSY
jgi:hypothetical protein